MDAGGARASLLWGPIMPLRMHPTTCNRSAQHHLFSWRCSSPSHVSHTYLLTGFGRRRVKLMADDGGLTFILDVAQHQW
jgi:hypothetical protein